MARTISEIYDEIIAEKELSTTLNAGLLPVGTTYDDLISELSAKSKVAVWRLWAYIVAVQSWVNEKLFDEHVAGTFHGHVRSWGDLSQRMQSALRKAGMANGRGLRTHGRNTGNDEQVDHCPGYHCLQRTPRHARRRARRERQGSRV